MNKNLVVFLLSLWQGLLAEEYSIQRRVTESGNVLPDRFVLPPSKCFADNAAVQCTTMGGKLVGSNNGCTCKCNKEKSTFAFYNSWKCIDNTKFHNLSGCSLMLNNRNARSPIMTITRVAFAEIYKLPTLKSSSNCGVTNKVSNLTCSGTWRQLSSGLVMETFDMYVPEGDNNWYLYTLRSLDDMEGQVIRLNIECESHRQYCVILKIKGTFRCPLPPRPSQSSTAVPLTTQIQSRPPSLPMPITRVTTAKPKTTHKRTSQGSVQTMTIPTTRSSILTEPVSSIPGHISTSRTKYSRSFTATTSISVKTDRKKSANKDKTGLITGALAGIIGLAIIVIAIMVLIKKRKKRKSNEQRTDTVDNAGYGRGEDNSLRFNRKASPDEDEYSYAYNNAAHFVNTNRQDLESHTNQDLEPGSSVVNQVYGQTDSLNRIGSAPYAEAPVYNTLEEAVYAKVDKTRKKCPFDSDAPIYNTIEEPEYTKVDKSPKPKLKENHNEPLYNVLEGPQTDDTTLEGLSDEPPCYHVLEGPFSQGVPVYDVLEGPDSAEAQVYGSFEGQNPRVYRAPDKRDVQVSSEENIGYDDILYDSVGDVINDQGDIYQELNQSGQRNSDVYQGLDYPGKTMNLNELNQTHSNA